MFGKQPTNQKPAAAPWSVQVLTKDYLIEGLANGADPVAVTFLEVVVGGAEDMGGSLLTLTQPKLQPVGAVAVGLPPNSNWVLPANTDYVAVIPHDDASRAYAAANLGPYKYTQFGAVVLAAQYVMRGIILCPGTDGLKPLSGVVQFAMREATIDYIGPGSKLTNMAVPFVLVSARQVRGIFVNA